MSDSIGLGAWVEHPTHGLCQVWDVWVDNPDNVEVPDEDDGVVLIVNDKGCHRVHRDTLRLADLGPELT